MKYSYGLIGEKLGHSYSKLIHDRMGYYDYELIPMPRDELGDFMLAREFDGINVTIPYKQDVIPFCSALSDSARKIGSVNTIVKLPDGTLYGDNTDYYGFLYMTGKAGISFKGRKTLVLGSGGTSLTACAAIRDEGGTPIVISRSGKNNYDNLYRHYDAEIIVNTTPLGMYPNTDACAVDLTKFPNCRGVVDVIYNPSRTRLLLKAEELGIAHTGGLSMLVAQAKKAGEIFTGGDISDSVIDEITGSLKRDMVNITLIGMPGSGKTSLGRIIADALNRPLYDIDTLIEEREGKTIPKIFDEVGEPGFRRIEAEILEKYSKKSGCVISTGGGCVLSEGNRKNIRQNSFVVYLIRQLDTLETSGRPLSRNVEALKKMETVRKPLYRACADWTADNNSYLETAANAIMEGFYETFGN